MCPFPGSRNRWQTDGHFGTKQPGKRKNWLVKYPFWAYNESAVHGVPLYEEKNVPNRENIYQKIGRPALPVLLCICLLLGGCREREEVSFLPLEEETVPAQTETVPPRTADEEQIEEAVCVVHICGAVSNPGVYELPAGSRIMDAVTAGGGFLPEADPDACNLAQVLEDGSRIYILSREESARLEIGVEAVQTGQTDAQADGRVDLNAADAAALMTLPGIGESRAAAILAWRRENGRFERIEDIMKVSGIKQAAFEKIRERITVR